MLFEEVKRIAYKKLAMRSYYSKEMEDLLIEKGADEATTEQVIKELTKLGYLNDEEWIQGAIRVFCARKYGPKRIAYKLQQKGVPPEEFIPFLEAVQHSQAEALVNLLQTRYKNRDFLDYKEQQKIIASLARKGYDFSHIMDALKKCIKTNSRAE